ncbi:MAG TPA: hypothetical protein VFS51_01015 [Gemmatimonadales bacterium]|nr:hypothetical protein [Gemmatimonadales bacterium]
MRRFCIGLIGLLACGDDDGTGPGLTDITGTWSATLSNLNGDGVSCSSTDPTQITFNQTGATFSGSFSGGELFCTAPGSTGAVPIGTGSVINGTVSGTNLSFDLDTPEFHHEGSVSGSSMSGTAEWIIDFGLPAGEVTLNGTWEAEKQ